MEKTAKHDLVRVKYSEYFRFIIVGFLNTGVDFLTFILLHNLMGMGIIISQGSGYCMGIINSFMMNRSWTFKDFENSRFFGVQFIRFLVINMISLFVSLIGLKVISETFCVNVFVAKIIVTGAAQVVNYIGYRFWAFG